jgi:hypothetical protein
VQDTILKTPQLSREVTTLKKEYEKPELIEYNDLKTVTAGGHSGQG